MATLLAVVVIAGCGPQPSLVVPTAGPSASAAPIRVPFTITPALFVNNDPFEIRTGAAGRVTGPYYAVQRVARGLDDQPLTAVRTELRAAVSRDANPVARAIFEREGWSVVRISSLTELALPVSAGFATPLEPLCGQAAVAHCADLSARVGLDLRAAAGRDVRVLRYVLEFPTPVGGGPYPPTGVAVAVGAQVVGAWVVSAVTRDVYAVSDRANVPVER